MFSMSLRLQGESMSFSRLDAVKSITATCRGLKAALPFGN